MNKILTLHDPQTAREHYRSGIWRADTFYSLLREHARSRPTAYALRDAYRRLTWQEVLEQVDAVADDLHRSGLRQGDRVAVWLPNRCEGVFVFLACSRNGYVCCPSLHYNYTVQELVHLLSSVQCKALFALPDYGADADRHSIFEQAAQIPSLQRIYALELQDGSAHSVDLRDAVPFPQRSDSSSVQSPPNLNPDKIVYLAFTSGTTGMPKGVMHSDNTLLANGRAMVSDWHHTEETIVLTLSPMSHHIGTVALEQMLVAGMELVLHNPGVQRSALDSILESGASYAMGVPTHGMDVLSEAKQRNLKQLGALKAFYLSGAAIPSEVAQQFLDRGVTPQNVLGMTENGSHVYTLPTDSSSIIVNTCGRACAGYEIRIWKQDDPDTEAAPGEVGEIGGRGGVLMLGYYDNQTATEASFNGSGWFMSGDLGVMDENGCLQVVGRKKDIIIRGGHNIYPARIEDLAHQHIGIAKAAAFPVADTRLGEKVCLAIICHDGAKLEALEVLQHLHQAGLSKYDMPEYFACMTSFPLTPSGKILKRELVTMVSSGQLVPEAVRWSGG
jgi:acyl-CoA synthetase